MKTYIRKKVLGRIVELEMRTYGSLSVSITVDNIRTTETEIIADVTVSEQGGTSTTYPSCVYPESLFPDCKSVEKSFDITAVSISTEKILDKLVLAEYNEEEGVLAVVKTHISKIRSYYAWLVSASSGQPNFKSPKYYADVLDELTRDANKYLTELYQPVG